MARNFRELEAKMPVDSVARAQARAKGVLGEMVLGELRRHAGLTQEEVAARLGIRQPSLSKIESEDDMQITTLNRLVEALGGKLEIIVHMPKGDIRLNQFKEAS